MFEKEAKEKARDFTENKERQVAYECGFLDGANRMRGEMQKLKEDNADLKQSLDWANERESEDCKRIAELEQEKCELLGIIQGKDKAIKELEEKISVLLSCKNCSENKGGYICEKEYENKCLSQKIQYIKELQEENEKLEKEIEISQRCWQEQKNISLDANCKLHKSKELLRELYVIVKVGCSPFFKDEHKTILTEIKEFLKEE